MLGSPSRSPRKPIHRMAKAARWISREKHGGDSPIRSCQVCTTAGSMAVELSSRSCRIFQGMNPQGSPDIAWQYPPTHELEYTVWHLRARGALGEFLPICLRLFALFQTTRRLLVPRSEARAINTHWWWSFAQHTKRIHQGGWLSFSLQVCATSSITCLFSALVTSEPSCTKQSFMNAKEHSNTETLGFAMWTLCRWFSAH